MLLRLKSNFAVSLVCVFLFVVTLAVFSQAQAATTLKFNHVFAPGSPADQAVHIFAENVEKRTNGEIDFKIYPSAQLGNVLGTYQGLTMGNIDATVLDVTLAGYIKGHEAFFIGQLPYLFESLEEAERIYNSEVFEPLFEELRKDKGIRTLTVSGHKQGRCLNTTDGPIFTPADGKGLKIRVMPINVCIKTFEAWGFKPTPVNWSELYMSLKQGIVDGQDNGPDLTCPQKFYEVAKYFAFTNHVYSSWGWHISEKTWNKIPQKYHAILQEEAKVAGQKLTEFTHEQEQNCIENMLRSGVKITIPNRPAFKEASKDVYKQFEGDLWPKGMVEEIKNMQ